MTPRPYNRRVRQMLGRRIRLRREELGLAQRSLTEAADLSSQRQVWGIEHGQTGMTIETARRVAHALGWSAIVLAALHSHRPLCCAPPPRFFLRCATTIRMHLVHPVRLKLR